MACEASWQRCRDFCLNQFTLGPFDIYDETLSRAQPANLSAGPNAGQGRQQFDPTSVALHQHFGHACGVSEVAVDLKWRVRSQQVGVKSTFLAFRAVAFHELEHVAQNVIGAIPVAQPCV